MKEILTFLLDIFNMFLVLGVLMTGIYTILHAVISHFVG